MPSEATQFRKTDEYESSSPRENIEAAQAESDAEVERSLKLTPQQDKNSSIPDPLKLSPDAEQVFDNEAFNLCKELKSIEHFSTRCNEIKKELKKKFPDRSVLVYQKPDGKDGESRMYYKCLWEPSVTPAQKAKPAKPKQNTLKFTVQAGYDE